MRMKWFAALVLAAVLGGAGWAQTTPVNPHATSEARALLAFLDSISGKAIVSGQHNYPNDGSRWTDLSYDLTGKYPGIFGGDFGFSGGSDKDSALSRPAMIAEAERQYRNGAIVTLIWHELRPTDDEPVTFHDSVQGHLSDYEWRQLLTPGTPLYKRWCAQVDVVAGYLRQLRDAHIPVLYRPYHEMNGNWFWWGGRPGKDGSAALYRQLYDRFVNIHHLDNLLWVWNANAPSGGAQRLDAYYPGPQYADVVSMDIYGEFKQEYYDKSIALAAGKPIALGEVGDLPSPEVLDNQPRWTYFMEWNEWIQTDNSLDQANAVYHAPQVLSRDDARLAAAMAAIRKAAAGMAPDAEPVTPGATREAKALLARLHAAPGEAAPIGQENDPSAPGEETAAIVQLTQRQPAIYASDLGGSLESRQAVLKEVLRQRANGADIYLSWHPVCRSDNTYSSRRHSGVPTEYKHSQLSDFEWNELLTPGSALNDRWIAQVDEVAATLRELEKAGVAVLWNPYPEPNGKGYWWAERKGIRGSGALYRMLFDRLVDGDGLRNLVWVWETEAGQSQPNNDAGEPSDFFPGLLYIDAVEAGTGRLDPRMYRDLEKMASGKVLGIELTLQIPPPRLLTDSIGWAWYLAGPRIDLSADSATRGAREEGLRLLYRDPRIASLAPAR